MATLQRGVEHVRSFRSLVEARAAAAAYAGLGEDTVKFVSELGPLKGQVVGSQSVDGLRGWRIDFHAPEGFHINWWDNTAGPKRAVQLYGANIIENGSYSDFINFLQHLQ